MKHKLYLLLSSLVFLSLFVAACGSPAATTTSAPAQTEAPAVTQVATEVPTEAPAATASPEPTKPLTVLIDNDEGPITPANFNTFIGGWMVGWVYDSLYIQSHDYHRIASLATLA